MASGNERTPSVSFASRTSTVAVTSANHRIAPAWTTPKGFFTPGPIGISETTRSAVRSVMVNSRVPCTFMVERLSSERPNERLRQFGRRHPIQRFVHADQERVAGRRPEHDTLSGQAFLDRGGVAVLHAQPEQVRARGHPLDRDAIVTLQLANQALGDRHGLAE